MTGIDLINEADSYQEKGAKNEGITSHSFSPNYIMY